MKLFVIYMGILISIILDAFPEESLTQILNIDHNFPEKEHIPKKKEKSWAVQINVLHSKENISALWVETMDASFQPLRRGVR